MSNRARGLTRRQFFEVSAASAAFVSRQKDVIGSQPLLGLDSIRDKNSKIKIWPDEQKQTIGFELPELPREVFKIVIPELVSDAEEPIIPWEQPSPQWDIDETSARWSTEIHNTVRMKSEVRFDGEQITARVKLTNLSPRRWEKVNAFTCFAYYAAPSFDDPELKRTYFPVDGKWKSVSELFGEHDPGSGPYTFFFVSGGPRLKDLWLGRKIPQHHPQVVSKGCACVVSKDGGWIAGMSTPSPAYVFHNRRERCIHADPFLGTVSPGKTVEGISTIHIYRGTLAAFMKRCDERS